MYHIYCFFISPQWFLRLLLNKQISIFLNKLFWFGIDIENSSTSSESSLFVSINQIHFPRVDKPSFCWSVKPLREADLWLVVSLLNQSPGLCVWISVFSQLIQGIYFHQDSLKYWKLTSSYIPSLLFLINRTLKNVSNLYFFQFPFIKAPTWNCYRIYGVLIMVSVKCNWHQ